ncbi:hypothetical protein [Methyloradius palustris]|uniref:Uncharacterized protein n=1 Tax=Methyloradius palustris TaxID=2778876 RepID=A0A8D5FZR8_9PROT|nr:hypothetical protein [Methyloradius palustris]BCM25172.1 hypothetical protein ZMTM_14310 [Methyloradius palustris]
MKKLLFAVLVSIFTLSNVVQAAGLKPDDEKPVFKGINYSGEYACKGTNDQVGDYEVSVTMRINRVSSYGTFGAYYFDTQTENSVIYRGQAVADGNRLAISFNLSDKRNSEHSTGIATIKKNAQGHWSFRKLYFESDDNGGIYGIENCVMTASLVAPVKKVVKPVVKAPSKAATE